MKKSKKKNKKESKKIHDLSSPVAKIDDQGQFNVDDVMNELDHFSQSQRGTRRSKPETGATQQP